MSKDEKKPEAAPSTVSEAIEKAIEKALPAAAMAAVSAMRGPQPKPQMTRDEKQLRCRECGQLVRGCHSQHRRVAVFPKMAVLEDVFPGIRLNGVTYRSNNPNHLILIPAESDIENMVTLWEERELINLRGRRKKRHSGMLSPSGANISNEPVSF